MKKIFTRTAYLSLLVGLGLTSNVQAQTYCIPTTSFGCSTDYIQSFSTTGGTTNITNNNTGCPGGDYTNYSATHIHTGQMGQNVNYSFTNNPSWSQGYKIWVDWNGNGTLNDPGEEIYASTSPIGGGATITGTFAIPLTATPGIKRLRIRCVYGTTIFDPCNSQSFGETEDYAINVIAATNCSTAVFPASATTQVSPATFCGTGNVDVNITPVSSMPAAGGITYQWQTGPTAAGPWTNAGAPLTSPSATISVTGTTYFRCQVLCNGNPTSLTSTPNNVTNIGPSAPTTQGDMRCGPGNLTLTATLNNPSNTLRWYTTPTGGAPIATGTTFNTPYITTTTTYYAAELAGGGTSNVQVGTATTSYGGSSYSPGPFSIYYRRSTMQILYTAAEIIAAGGGGGAINSLAFNCTGVPMYNLLNYTVRVATVPSTMTTLTWQPMANFTQVFNTASYMPTTGWQTINFASPYNWNGVDNIVVYLCWDQTQPSFSASGDHQYTSTTGKFLYSWTDGAGSSCGETGSISSTYRPNVIFNISMGCESPRVPTVASISTPPIVTVDHPAVICNDVKHPLTVTSNLSNYTSYVWSSNIAGSLYSDVNTLIPYSGANTSNVYFRSTVAGLHSVVVTSTNSVTQCVSSDTFNIWVQPDGVSIVGDPDTICISGTSDLVLSNLNYAPGSVQWQSSSDGVNYTNITGANGVTYTTPTLTAGMYYRVIVSSDDGECLNSPTKYVHVIDPQIATVNEGVSCGPGNVTLTAFAGSTGTIVSWYDVPSGGTPLDTGNTFVTPYLNSTTTFYASARGAGAGMNLTAQLGTGTGVLAGNPNPYYTLYYGHRNQYLIRASELIALGFTAGKLMSLGFDVVANSGLPLTNFTIKMGHTNLTTMPATWQTGLTQVYTTAVHMPVANSINTHVFQTPFVWDGVSNIIIETCFNNSNWSSGHSVRYTSGYSFNCGIYGYADNMTVCTGTTPFTTTSRPNMIIHGEEICEGDRIPVIAYIHDKPNVDLGPDIIKCVDPGHLEFLNAANFGSDYLWDNNYNGMVRVVPSSGTYWVQVTNSFGCTDSDTINVTFKPNPLVDLGNDTTVCNGVTLTLDGGTQGVQYYWNTGQTTSTINVNNPGTYSVQVTGDNGCVKVDSITVNMQGQLPTSGGIMVNNLGPFTFSFTLVNPLNIIGYQWSFGDGNYSSQPNPVHTYSAVGNYVVTLNLTSVCGYGADSVTTHIYTKIDELNFANGNVLIYPNPTKDNATITCKEGVVMKSVKLTNVMGQVILHENVTAQDKHELNLNGIASGMYNVDIETDKGIVTKKLEVVK